MPPQASCCLEKLDVWCLQKLTAEVNQAMTTFPERESEIATLAQNMISGFNANTEIYPTPVIAITEFDTAFKEYQTAQQQAVAAKAACDLAFAAKRKALKALSGIMKSNLRYAEAAVKHSDNSDDKLKLLGWGGPAPANPLRVPGVVRQLDVSRSSSGAVRLHWKAPRGGGRVAAYLVQHFDRDRMVWQTLETVFEPELKLSGQQAGQALECRVVAINRAGEGTPSNTVFVAW